MSTVDFLESPSDELLNAFTKVQLMELAEHYIIDLGEKTLKKEIKQLLRTTLGEQGVLPVIPSYIEPAVSPSVALTSQQQKELLLLQMERVKMSIEKP